MKFTVKVTGIADTQKMLNGMAQAVENEIDMAVERRALLMINEIKSKAPIKSSKLVNSFDIVPQFTKPMERTIGTEVEYATRQEYEHKTKKGFVRTTVAIHEPLLKQDVQDAIDRAGGGV